MLRPFVPAVAVALALLAGSRADDAKPVEPFNGKDLKGWKFQDEKKSKWEATWVRFDSATPTALLVNPQQSVSPPPRELGNMKGGGTDISTDAAFGDVHLELEFMIPKGSNSGVYLMGEYEVQIIDSFGKADDQLKPGDMGGLYTTAAPKKNACKKPGEWQTFVIDFQAPKFHADKKVVNAKFVKVTLNGVVIHEDVEMKQQTPGGLTGKEHPTGPLMLQGNHGPVAFRNIKITPRK